MIPYAIDAPLNPISKSTRTTDQHKVGHLYLGGHSFTMDQAWRISAVITKTFCGNASTVDVIVMATSVVLT